MHVVVVLGTCLATTALAVEAARDAGSAGRTRTSAAQLERSSADLAGRAGAARRDAATIRVALTDLAATARRDEQVLTALIARTEAESRSVVHARPGVRFVVAVRP